MSFRRTWRRIVIAGHIHPDGDCVGSCLGLKNYLAVIRPEAQVDVYLEKFSEDFIFLQGAGEVCHELPESGTLRCRHSRWTAAIRSAWEMR